MDWSNKVVLVYYESRIAQAPAVWELGRNRSPS
jgi:hypothetical protein